MDNPFWKEPEDGPLVDVTMTYYKLLLTEFGKLWTKRHIKMKFLLIVFIGAVLCGLLLWYGLVHKKTAYVFYGEFMAGGIAALILLFVRQPKQIAKTQLKLLSGDTFRMQVFPDFIVSWRVSEEYVAQSKCRYEAIQDVYEGEGLFCLFLKSGFQIIDKRALSPAEKNILRQLFTQKLGKKFKELN